MSTEHERSEGFSKPPVGYLGYIGEAAVGTLVEVVVVTEHLPDLVAVPLMLVAGAAIIHGAHKAFRSAMDSES